MNEYSELLTWIHNFIHLLLYNDKKSYGMNDWI